MPGRIVLFGATGYTGRLTAEALVARGVLPVLAARSAEKLESLAAEVRLDGQNAYAFTAGVLAWAAGRVADRGLERRGALAPADALEPGCREAGLARV